MKKTLDILLLVAPTITFANTMQSPEQSVKTALDCKKAFNPNELEKNVRSLSSGTFNGHRGKVYKLTSPIKYGNLNIGAVLVTEKSPAVIGYLQESMPITLEGIKKRLPSSTALIKSKYHDEVASYSREIHLKKNDVLSSSLRMVGENYELECFREQW